MLSKQRQPGGGDKSKSSRHQGGAHQKFNIRNAGCVGASKADVKPWNALRIKPIPAGSGWFMHLHLRLTPSCHLMFYAAPGLGWCLAKLKGRTQ